MVLCPPAGNPIFCRKTQNSTNAKRSLMALVNFWVADRQKIGFCGGGKEPLAWTKHKQDVMLNQCTPSGCKFGCEISLLPRRGAITMLCVALGSVSLFPPLLSRQGLNHRRAAAISSPRLIRVNAIWRPSYKQTRKARFCRARERMIRF